MRLAYQPYFALPRATLPSGVGLKGYAEAVRLSHNGGRDAEGCVLLSRSG